MRFLVIGEQVAGMGPAPPDQMASFVENVIQPSLRMLDQWEKEGRIKGGVFPGARKGAMIVDAGSAEEVDEMLTSLPFWGIMRFEVSVLIAESIGLERTQQMLERMHSQGPS